MILTNKTGIPSRSVKNIKGDKKMRNLTIRREKTFTASLMKMKIYIEDPSSQELIINDTPCRKIGELKNGEEKAFQISENSAKVFVIADKISKDYCNEFYQLPEGQEDIFLTGKNLFNPANGNAFRFAYNQTDAVSVNRKKNTVRGSIILVIAVIIGGIIGYLISDALFSPAPPEEKVFASDGMTITMTDEFKETGYEGFTAVYESKTVALFVIKEPFTLVPGVESITLEEYAGLIFKNNGIEPTEIKKEDGLTYFEYEFLNPELNETFTYFSFIFKTDDAFWLIQFATAKKDAEENRADILGWAKSVSFS